MGVAGVARPNKKDEAAVEEKKERWVVELRVRRKIKRKKERGVGTGERCGRAKVEPRGCTSEAAGGGADT